MKEVFRIQNQVTCSIFVDFPILILKGLTAVNVLIDIPEVREIHLNDDGLYVNSDDQIVSWYKSPYFTFWLSILLSVASIYSNISDMI
jgi:hypothetical protein